MKKSIFISIIFLITSILILGCKDKSHEAKAIMFRDTLYYLSEDVYPGSKPDNAIMIGEITSIISPTILPKNNFETNIELGEGVDIYILKDDYSVLYLWTHLGEYKFEAKKYNPLNEKRKEKPMLKYNDNYYYYSETVSKDSLNSIYSTDYVEGFVGDDELPQKNGENNMHVGEGYHIFIDQNDSNIIYLWGIEIYKLTKND